MNATTDTTSLANGMPIRDSEEQAKVIHAPAETNVLVVAGAGSGKTYTMTRRIIALIESGVAPERILGLTFTRKAAGELLERVSAAVARQGAQGDGERLFLKPAVFTYDAFFQSIVRQYGLLVGFDQNTQPLSAAGALALAAGAIEKHLERLDPERMGDFAGLARQVLALSNALGSAMIGEDCATIAEAIDRCRQWDGAFAAQVRQAIGGQEMPEGEASAKPPKRAKKDSDEDWERKRDAYLAKLHANCVFHCGQLLETAEKRDILLDLVEEYDHEKRRLNMAEFSDFTIAAYQLVHRFPSIGQRYRRRFSHVLLDEYQDTSTTQAALLAALFHGSGDSSALNAVGDPFQSIYAWRGASPGAFRMFQQALGMEGGGKPYALSTTRRNARIILEAANNLTAPLRVQPRRGGSSLMREVDVPRLSNLPDAPEGTLGVLGYQTRGQEIDGVTRFCQEAVRCHTHDGRRGRAAVLFRSKKTMPAFRDALEQTGLSVFVVGQSALLERPEVMDTLALLRVAADHRDSASLMRLLATPRFAMGQAALSALARLAEQANAEARFRALAEAGVADPEASADERAQIVRDHRDEVANLVFLADLLARDDAAELVEAEGKLSRQDMDGVRRIGMMLRRVQEAVGRPLPEVVREAVQALDLDVDTVVAQAMRSPGIRVNPSLAHMPTDAIGDLVETYTSEIAADRTPTLSGFVAWVDALEGVEDETAAMHDERADVELMSVHQSKGLEWDAVAIVGMAEGTFPSNTGDHLKITADERHAGGMGAEGWQPPEYHETARTWLSDPTAVPAPMRADAGILPRFPHDAPPDDDPITALGGLDDVEVIDDEVFGSMRAFGDGVEEVDPESWYLTQAEEYGRRLHADERRLAYVALTRARHDVLLTYAATADMSRRPKQDGNGGKTSKPSNFWTEVRDSLSGRPDVVDADAAGDGWVEGFFAGQEATRYERIVVEEARTAPQDEREESAGLAWPASLGEAVRSRLQRAQEEAALAQGVASNGNMPETGATGAVDAPSMPGAADTAQVHGPASLLERARLLVADEDLMDGGLSEAELNQAIERKARRILASGRQSVTALQALASELGSRSENARWRAIVRPIPSVASPAAEAGTVFHEWAERFVNAGKADALGEGGETREGLLEELAERERSLAQETVSAGADDGARGRLRVERQLAVWQRRLASSPWAKREPAWAERQIVVGMPALGGTVVNGKLDAVFHGGLDMADDTKRYTVVDWKTGRRPTEPKDIERTLAQLDWYRLLLSALEDVPLASIDAALYYLSEADEEARLLTAEPKGLEQIVAGLAQGVPEMSDND